MLLDTLKTMLSIYGPTGQEGKVAEKVQEMLQGKVDAMKVDVMGNLIVEKKGRSEEHTSELQSR